MGSAGPEELLRLVFVERERERGMKVGIYTRERVFRWNFDGYNKRGVRVVRCKVNVSFCRLRECMTVDVEWRFEFFKRLRRRGLLLHCKGGCGKL